MKHYRLPIIFALLVLALVLELVERSSIKPRIVQPFEFEELTVSSFEEVPDVDSLYDQKITMGWSGKTKILLKTLLFSVLSGAGDGTRTHACVGAAQPRTTTLPTSPPTSSPRHGIEI